MQAYSHAISAVLLFNDSRKEQRIATSAVEIYGSPTRQSCTFVK